MGTSSYDSDRCGSQLPIVEWLDIHTPHDDHLLFEAHPILAYSLSPCHQCQEPILIRSFPFLFICCRLVSWHAGSTVSNFDVGSFTPVNIALQGNSLVDIKTPKMVTDVSNSYVIAVNGAPVMAVTAPTSPNGIPTIDLGGSSPVNINLQSRKSSTHET